MKKLLLAFCFIALFAAIVAAQPAPSAPPDAAKPVVAAQPMAPVAQPAPVKPAEPAAPAVAPVATPVAPDAPPPDITKVEQANPSTFWHQMRVAWRAKKFGPVVGFILMLIVFVLTRFFWKSFPGKWLPYLSIVVGVFSETGWQLALGGQLWWEAILSGLSTGLLTIGAWETIGKKAFGKVSDRQALPPTPDDNGDTPVNGAAPSIPKSK